MKKIFTELSVLVCFCLLLLSDVAYAQNVTVKGTVNDDQNLPIPSVSIMIKGTTNGVQTDASGNYTITVPTNATLVFSFIGFATQEIPVNNRTTINITLVPSTNDLQQVVVVGYGTQKKVDVTGSISSVKGEEIEKLVVTNPISALQGKVPGLTVTNGGTPGSNPVVRIRGIASTNNSDPLYVVDGILQDNIDFLNPGDIETIDLLKDASSTAIYGLRGANGVIAITTKRAARGKTSINLQSTIGIQHVDKLIDVVDAEGFKKLYSAAVANTNNPPFDFSKYTGNTNWQEEILRDAYINTNALTISNNSEKSTTLISLGYNDQDGVVKYSNFKKFNARLNEEIRINENIKVGADLTGFHYRNEPINVNLNSGIWAAPVVPVKGDNGLYNTMPSFQRAQVGNPVYAIERMRNTAINRGYRFNGSLYGEVKFLKNFTWRSSVYTDLRFNSRRNFTPAPYPVNHLEGSATPVFLDPAARTRVDQYAFERRMYQQDHTVNFEKTINNNHRISAMAGFTSVYISNTTMEGSRTDTTLTVPFDPNLWYLNIISRDNPITNSGAGFEESNAGFFGRVSYAFKDRYLLNATIRRDGSSKFAPENRWGTFGSIGLGWVVSEEDFFKNNIKIINFLKLRAAWGRLGNSNAFGANLFQQGLNTSTSAVFGLNVFPAVRNAYIADPGLRWEIIEGLDIGAEFKLLNSKLSGEVNYYDKKTKDLFTSVTLPGSNDTFYTNLGQVTNRGVEVNLGWNDKIGSDFRYGISGNFSYVKNRVDAIGPELNFRIFPNSVNLTETGKSIGHFYGYKQIGIFQTTHDLDVIPRQPTNSPGDIIFADLNGDGKIDGADRTYLGTPFPPYSYGLNINFGYKNFDFLIEGQGVAGNKIYLQRRTANFAPINYEANRLNAWSGLGTSNIEPIINARNENLVFSDYFLESGSYFRLRNVQIGYTFPKGMLAKAGIQKLRIYASGQNVKTWSKVSGYTPEAQIGNITAGGADNGIYPVPVIYSFGINVGF